MSKTQAGTTRVHPKGPAGIAIIMSQSTAPLVTFKPLSEGDSSAVLVRSLRAEAGRNAQGCYFQWTLAATFGGACRYRAQPGDIMLQPGDLLISQPGTPISWEVPRTMAPGRQPHWSVVFAVFEPRPHWHQWLAYEETAPGFMHLHPEPALFEEAGAALEEAERRYREGATGRDEWTFLALEKALLILHLHYQRKGSPFDDRVERAMQFVQAHYSRPLTLAEIAAAAPLSVSQLSLLFSRQLGQTPVQYLENVRLARATEMLKFSQLTIGEIAAACGFRDPDYFSRRFQLRTRKTPRAFRRQAENAGHK